MHRQLSAVKSIKIHCRDCSGGSYIEQKNCIITDCVLYPFRLGKNPNRKSKKLNADVPLDELSRKSGS